MAAVKSLELLCEIRKEGGDLSKYFSPDICRECEIACKSRASFKNWPRHRTCLQCCFTFTETWQQGHDPDSNTSLFSCQTTQENKNCRHSEKRKPEGIAEAADGAILKNITLNERLIISDIELLAVSLSVCCLPKRVHPNYLPTHVMWSAFAKLQTQAQGIQGSLWRFQPVIPFSASAALAICLSSISTSMYIYLGYKLFPLRNKRLTPFRSDLKCFVV